VWVGLTGTLDSIYTTRTAYLPQIGTNSNCVSGKPQYSGVYELFHACNLSDVLACFQGENTIDGFKVSSGDESSARIKISVKTVAPAGRSGGLIQPGHGESAYHAHRRAGVPHRAVEQPLGPVRCPFQPVAPGSVLR
jgi:hypothetical protein